MINLSIHDSYMKIDLHTHSTASDGQYMPIELVQKAISSDIRLFAITDHDTVQGLADAEKYAKAQSLFFVPGIEISTQDVEEIHILGYGIDYNNSELVSACEVFAKARSNRGQVIVDYLKSLNIDVDLNVVKSYAGTGSLGRPHFARYLMEHKIVKSRKEAFDKYLDTKDFKKATDRKKPTCLEAIKLIHRAGGKAVLAHPGIYLMSEASLVNLVERLVEIGIDGIECFYSKHSKLQTEKYLEYIHRYNLKTSCGSDFHGERVKSDIQMGMVYDFEKYGKNLIICL